jgi:mutator protein MutT
MRDSRYLIAQRPLHKRHGGLWEFPGGKFELGESPIDAARRELAEELGVAVTSVGECLLEVHDEGSPFVIEFYPVWFEGEPTALEHEELRWATLEELTGLPLAPADARMVHYLRRPPESGASIHASPIPDRRP